MCKRIFKEVYRRKYDRKFFCACSTIFSMMKLPILLLLLELYTKPLLVEDLRKEKNTNR